ncbi:MAG: hypothetical protein HYS57_01450 [Parcubacteria group bacterium]|nr:hypothetical protein [Parcubacteria group bacterium]
MLAERIKRRRLRKAFRTVAVGGVCFGVGFLVWLGFFSPLLTVGTVRVEGSADVEREGIVKAAESMMIGKKYGIFPKNHPLFIDERFLEATLVNTFTQFASVKVGYNFFDDTLDLRVVVRKPVAHWCGRSQCFLIDQQGVIYAKAGEREGSLTLVIRDEVERNARIGMKVLPAVWMDFFSTLRDYLKPIAWVTSVTIEEESLGAHYARFHVVDGWDLVVDVDSDPSRISQMVKTLFEREIGEKVKRLSYIDLRTPNRAYYKLR